MGRIITGGGLAPFAEITDKSVNCCITSPPYWGLRDYGTAKWIGGNPDCDHVADSSKAKEQGNPEFNVGRPSRQATLTAGYYYAGVCGKCGAVREDSQIGLERTPDEYIAKLVAVFREVKRVLRDDGTLWLNLGDSYAGSGKGRNPDGTVHVSALIAKQGTSAGTVMGNVASGLVPDGLKAKDLVGIPWRVAFALQSDGWYLRQDIIWSKPNPMPESVTDRCTKAHEYIFLLTKSPRYYYDSIAIKEPSVYPNDKRRPLGSKGAWQMDGREQGENGGGKAYEHDTSLRNRRSVWSIPTRPFKGAHFATFPETLIEPMVLAGCPEGGVILDPFFGSGTTGVVAIKNKRDYIGIELNPSYVAMAEERIRNCEMQIKDSGAMGPMLF